MKRNQWHIEGLGKLVLTGVTSWLLAATALGQYSATQPSGITIPDYPALPTTYPQEFSISNVVGRISKVTVSLNNTKHAYASDLSALLVYKDTNNVSGSVVLMSAAGGSSELNGVNIAFDDEGATLPQFTQIGAGPYKPKDYAGVIFPGSAATNAPYKTSLTNAFQGMYPNGKWSLYMYDAAAVQAGQIGSWTVNVWTYPVIGTTNSAIAIRQNESGTYYFTVNSSTTDPANLTVTAKSQNTDILPDANLVRGGSGQNRTLTITPKTNELRPVTVKITVADTGGSVTTDLNVTITPVNQPPTIALSTNTVYTTAGVITAQVTATVADFDNAPSDLKIQVTSSDDSIVSSNNVFFASTTVAARNFTVVPTGNASGQATLTFKVSDTNNASATTTLTVNVAPQTHPQFASTKVLGFSAAGTTNSSIVVSNIPGKIGSATVALTGLKAMQPSITDIALVVTNSFRANGGNVNVFLLNSPLVGSFDYARVRFDNSGNALPGASSINEVTVGANLDTLNGFDANGTWTLWVTNGGAGSMLQGGWVIDLRTAPSVTTSVTNVVMNTETETTATFALADLDGAITNASDVSVTSADTSIVTAERTYSVDSKTGTVKFKSTTPKSGTTTVTLTAKDNDNYTVSFVFNVTVNFVNHPPVISFIPKVDTTAGTPASTDTITVTDADVGYAVQTYTFTARSSDQKLIPDSNLVFTGTGMSRVLTMYPLGTNTGLSTISVIVSDGVTNTTTTFQLTVKVAGNPLFANLGGVTMSANSAAVPYPSMVTVSGLVGGVADVEVTLFGINNNVPDDMNVMLVSPNGKTNVLLMSHVGGAVSALANTILTFSDAATSSLPDSSQITTGKYKPTAFTPTPTFPTPAPTPRVVPLAAFAGLNGTNLNGTWSLFVYDDGLGRGSIANGWQLSIRTAPSIQPIADVTMPKQADNPTSKDIVINIGDDQPGANISVVATSLPTGVITTEVVGTGGTRTLKITPLPYQIGTNVEVTVTATSSLGAPSTQKFFTTVYFVNLPPVISTIPGITNFATAFASTTFTVWDPQQATLTLTGKSDNERLIPNANIDIDFLGTQNGTNTYQLTLLPADIQEGTAQITVDANDNVNQKASKSFYAQINHIPAFLAGAIIIPQGAPVAADASPYPSKTTVSGLDGYVTGVEVTLLGLNHTYPADVEILLVSPDNKASIVLASAGSSIPVIDSRISIADGGTVLQPSTALQNFGRYAPASFSSSLNFGVPNVPTSSYKTNLASLTGLGTNPNGEWSLYVRDNTYPVGGTIAGWILTLKTSPAFAPGSVVDTQTAENTTLAVPITVVSQTTNAASLVVYASAGVSSPTNLPNFNLVSNLLVTNNGGGNRTLIITPTPNLPSSRTNVNGTLPINLQVVDGQITNTASFQLTVLWANQPPAINTSTNNLYLSENPLSGPQSSVEVTFSLSDVDSKLFTSNAVVRFADSSLIPNNTNHILVTSSTDIINQGATGQVTVKLTPASGVSGTNNLSLTITDGTATSVSVVTLNVKAVYQPPYITGLSASYSSPAGVPAGPYSFTVGSVEGVVPSSLLLSAKSSSQGLVPDSQIILGGTDASRSITMTPIGTVSGSTTITLTLADPLGKATNTSSFVLNVGAPAPGIFGNAQVVTVVGNPTNAPSWTYPLVFSVTNLVGSIDHVSFEMLGYSNSSPTSLDALLVAPDQTAVSLTSGGGGTDAVDSLSLMFDDSGIEMPTVGPLTSGTYHPSYYTKRILPGNPTTNIYQARMRAFEGKTTNAYLGDWKLYLNQQAFGTLAKFSGGMFLKVTPAPQIVVTNTTIALVENARDTLYFNVEDSLVLYGTNLILTAESDNTTLLPVGQPSSPATNNSFQLPLNPSLYASGSANVTLTATRKSDNVQSSVVVRVTVGPKNFPPTISRLLNVATPANTPVSIQFLVSDPDTAINVSSNMMVAATSDNRAVLDPTNMIFGASGSNVVKGLPLSKVPGTSELVLSMNPNPFVIGSANVTITVTDSLAEGTNIVTSNFVFTAENRIFDPTIGTVPAQSVVAGKSTAPISLTVGSPNVPAPDLQVTGVSSDATLILNAGIAVTPAAGGVNVSAWSVVVSALPQSGGFTPRSAVITLTVRDKTNNRTSSTSFNVTVLPPSVYAFANTNGIQIVDNAKANPYPSQVDVSGLVGNVSKVTATLHGFSHRYPADVNVLLVGPGATNKVVLMNKAGGGTPISPTNTVTLTFDMSAPNAIPAGTGLTTGLWKPANYNASYNFPDVAAGPYSSDLAVFNNAQANGAWTLYVVDDSPPDAGAIQGWSLSIETVPVLTLSTNYLAMNMNTTNAVAISIQDDAPPGQYTFGSVATNTTLIPANGVTFTGSGSKYTATVVPALNQYGTNEVTIWATNILNQYVSTKFLVNVMLVTNPPVIVPVATQSIVQAQVGSVDFAYGDALVPQKDLIVSFASSNPGLIPASNISLANATSSSVGVSTNKLVFIPVGSQTGTADITVTVAAPANRGGKSSSSTFTVNVLVSPTPVFGNNASISILDRAPGNPYPSTIVVPASVVGKLHSVSLDINSLTHSFPADISMMLVGPKGQKVVLMSRAGDGAPLSGATFQFNQAAPTAVPQNSSIQTGTAYKPANYNPALTFYDGPPAGPIVTNLNVFAGTDPIGTWSLYVQDDQSPDSGTIAYGWTLRLVTTAPTISAVPPQVTPENTTLLVPISVNSPVVASSNLTVTVSSSGSVPSNLLASVTVAMSATNNAENKRVGTITITPTTDLPSAVSTADGTSSISVGVSDGTNTVTTTFPLTVLYVNQPPKFVGLSNLSTPANINVSQPFSLTDVDSTSGAVALAGVSSSIPALGVATVALTDDGYLFNFVPSGDVGITTVSLVATDGVNFTTNTFTVNVGAGAPPVIVGATELITAEGTTNATLQLALSISNSTPDMTLAAVSSNPGLATARTTGAGANWTVFVEVSPYVSGEAVIGLTATTKYGNGNSGFKVTVTQVDYAPSIATIPAQSTTANIPVTVPLIVTDPDTALGLLNITAASSDTNLVTSILVANDGTNISAKLNVAECKTGVATITVTVVDNTNIVTSAFQLTVAAPEAPVIEDVEDITETNSAITTISVPLSIESPIKPLSALTIKGTSSNTNLVSDVLIVVTDTNATVGMTLVSGKKGVSTITITVNDCVTTVTETFKVIVPEPTPATMTATVEDGVMTINLTGGAGTTYTIQNSIDMVTWTDETTVTADGDGKASYDIILADKPSIGFYRSVIK